MAVDRIELTLRLEVDSMSHDIRVGLGEVGEIGRIRWAVGGPDGFGFQAEAGGYRGDVRGSAREAFGDLFGPAARGFLDAIGRMEDLARAQAVLARLTTRGGE
jgi:hypothetical protein